MQNDEIKILEIISLELDDLQKIAQKKSLSLEETKRFETIVKLRQLMTNQPTEITQNNISEEDFNNEDLTKTLRELKQIK